MASFKRSKAAAAVSVELCEVKASDVASLYELEAASYPADEAATLEGLTLRQREAGDYFRVMMVDGSRVGFVCGTRCEAFTEESMATHAPRGPVLAIHSVVVEPSWRRRGVALDAIRQYAAMVSKDPSLESIKLIAKAAVLPLYVGGGWRVDGLSAIVHGRDPWFQCSLDAMSVDCRVVDAFSSGASGAVPATKGRSMGLQLDWFAPESVRTPRETPDTL